MIFWWPLLGIFACKCRCCSRFRCQVLTILKTIHSFAAGYFSYTEHVLVNLPQPMQVLISGHFLLWLRHFSTGYVSKNNSIFQNWVKPISYSVRGSIMKKFLKWKLDWTSETQPPSFFYKSKVVIRFLIILLYMSIGTELNWTIKTGKFEMKLNISFKS